MPQSVTEPPCDHVHPTEHVQKHQHGTCSSVQCRRVKVLMLFLHEEPISPSPSSPSSDVALPWLLSVQNKCVTADVTALCFYTITEASLTSGPSNQVEFTGDLLKLPLASLSHKANTGRQNAAAGPTWSNQSHQRWPRPLTSS